MSESIQDKVDEWVRPEIRALEAYHVPDATGLIKLDAMENPYPWPDAIRRPWLEVLGAVAVNRYPDPEAVALKQCLREWWSPPPEADLLLGNGSDELIQIMLLALARPGAVVLAPVPTFVMYEAITRAVGMRFVGVPLDADFDLDLPAMRAALGRHHPAVVFLAYPNNPTGNLFARTKVEALLADAPGAVVVDEAYHAFAGETLMGRLGEHPSLIVMRTLSKQGLAGLRLGILAARAEWVREFNKVRLPYNVNSLTQASAAFALAHRALFDEQAQRLCTEREYLHRALDATAGVRVWPSRANFLLFRVVGQGAREVCAALRREGVLVKSMHGYGGVLADCLRVTVGTREENAAFLGALGRVVRD